jgi:hypothetical protein
MGDHVSLRTAVGGEHQPVVLDGDTQEVERVSAVKQDAWSKRPVGDAELELMRAVAALMIQQEHGQRLVGSCRRESRAKVQAALPFVNIEQLRIMRREPGPAPTMLIRQTSEPAIVRRGRCSGETAETPNDNSTASCRKQRPTTKSTHQSCHQTTVQQLPAIGTR